MKNLSPKQEDYLPSIMWLISPNHDNRCTGRTRTLAYAFIKTAILNPRRDICIFDHLVHPTSFMQVMREIRLMLGTDEFKDYKIKINVSTKCIICEN